MQEKLLENKWLLIYVLIIAVVASRLLPHPMNFAPIGALGLFSGAYLQDKRAWLVPLVALFISDFFIGFYNPLVMLSVYASFAIGTLIGRFFLSSKRSVLRIIGGALSTATVLFVLSNFALWAATDFYPNTTAGLIACYVNAIPFYGNTLAGDLFYSFTLFGLYELSVKYLTKDKVSTQIV